MTIKLSSEQVDEIVYNRLKECPDVDHPNWEIDKDDEVYTALRNGNFRGWEEFARFLFEINKVLRNKK